MKYGNENICALPMFSGQHPSSLWFPFKCQVANPSNISSDSSDNSDGTWTTINHSWMFDVGTEASRTWSSQLWRGYFGSFAQCLQDVFRFQSPSCNYIMYDQLPWETTDCDVIHYYYLLGASMKDCKLYHKHKFETYITDLHDWSVTGQWHHSLWFPIAADMHHVVMWPWLKVDDSLYWVIQAGLFTPLTFALAAFTSGVYFLHNGRRWQWICEFYTANFKGIFGGQ